MEHMEEAHEGPGVHGVKPTLTFWLRADRGSSRVQWPVKTKRCSFSMGFIRSMPFLHALHGSAFRVRSRVGMDRLFTSRDRLVWAACFLIAATLIVVTGFTSVDGDSALYAGISEKLAQQPASRWIAPQWWGLWTLEGLFREHPAGLFFI